MSTKSLKISNTLSLPLDFVTKTAAILAQRRKGKTYTASVIAEEMVAAQQPFVALDPTGAWWGLRASSDAKSDGLPVVVLGGQHGDVPLERTGGRLIADLVVEEPGYYVIDFSLFESGEAERQFAVDFAERLYRAKGAVGKDFPLHLFVDECDRFIPQQMRKGSKETSPRLLGAFEAIVRRGGLRGLGTTLISQRAAVVNKNVLEMIDVLITLRTVGPNDQRAILEYVKAHGDDVVRTKMMESLASLDVGEAYIWEPGADLFQLVRIRQRRTFNSSATPKPGEKRVEPKRLAAVDLAVLQKRMAATVEKAKADDPTLLRKRIAELERAAKQQTPAPRAAAPDAKAIRDAQDAGYGEAIRHCSPIIDHMIEELAPVIARECTAVVTQRMERLRNDTLRVLNGGKPKRLPAAPIAALVARVEKKIVETHISREVVRDDRIGGTEQKILDTLAGLADLGIATPDKAMTAALVGYHPNAKTYANAMGALRSAGKISYPTGGCIALTDEGRAIATSSLSVSSLDELHRVWFQKLGDVSQKILEPLLSAYPEAIAAADVAAAANYHPNAKSFANMKGRLRSLGLIDYPETGMIVATRVLFPDGLR